MKCKQCNHEVLANAKFCPECGAKQELNCAHCGAPLNPDARFCGECGTKVDAKQVSQPGSDTSVVASIPISPLPLPLPDCRVSVQEVSTEGPFEDGDLRVTVKYTVTNDTDEDWEYLDVRTQLISAVGQIIEENRDNSEQTVSAGESAECESYFWGIKAKLLGDQIDRVHAVVTVTACGCVRQKLGEVAIPATSHEVVAIKSAKLGDTLQLVSGSLWKTEPDDDKYCRLELKTLVQNLTDRHLPEVRLMAEITDKNGREISDAGTYDEVRPGAVAVLSGSAYVKEKMLVGAKVDIALRAYWPVATGMTQHQGLLVSAPEARDTAYGHDEAESSESRVHGNLFKITVGRLASDWSLETNDGLVYANDPSTLGSDAQTIELGVAWVDDGVYLIHGGESRYFEDIDQASGTLREILGDICTEDEIEEAILVASVQDDADYDWTNRSLSQWVTSLGEMGEVRLYSDDFKNSLVINVTPYYDQMIDLGSYPYGDADGEPEDRHEFCGVRKNPNFTSTTDLNEKLASKNNGSFDTSSIEVFIAKAQVPNSSISESSLLCAIFTIEEEFDESTVETYSLVYGYSPREGQVDHLFKYYDCGANIAVSDSTGGNWDSAFTYSTADDKFSAELEPPQWTTRDAKTLEKLHSIKNIYLEIAEDDDGDQFLIIRQGVLDELTKVDSNKIYTAYSTDNFDDEKLTNFSDIWKLQLCWN